MPKFIEEEEEPAEGVLHDQQEGEVMRTPPIPQEETPPMLQGDMPPDQEETPPLLQDDIPPMLNGETLTVLQGETPPILGSDIPIMLQGETPPVLETDLTAVDTFLFAQPLETPSAPAPAQYREMRGGRSHPCPTCDKTFTSAAYLRQHVVFHAPAKEFECEVCGKRYQNANSLHQHRRDCHRSGSPTKVFSCADCGQIFAAQRYLTEHRRRKHSAAFQRPACQVCGKSFAGRTELATHQSVHTGERPFACAVCGKTCRLRSVLRMHARQGWKKPVFQKTQPSGFFVFVFFWIFWFFIYLSRRESFYGFFSFKKNFRFIQTLNYNHSY